jgi:hypothetical protein
MATELTHLSAVTHCDGKQYARSKNKMIRFPSHTNPFIAVYLIQICQKTEFQKLTIVRKKLGLGQVLNRGRKSTQHTLLR